jgi:broad specificity phosphatase PhoE
MSRDPHVRAIARVHAARDDFDLPVCLSELKDENITTIYASPLLRTRQTAGIFAKAFNLPIHFSKLLIEVKLFCQGVALSEFKAKIQPTLYDKENLAKGQESIEEIEVRMMKFFDMIKKKHAGKTVLSVSHGDPIVIMHSLIAQKPFTWEFKRDNYVKTARYLIIETGENDSSWHVVN